MIDTINGIASAALVKNAGLFDRLNVDRSAGGVRLMPRARIERTAVDNARTTEETRNYEMGRILDDSKNESSSYNLPCYNW